MNSHGLSFDVIVRQKNGPHAPSVVDNDPRGDASHPGPANFGEMGPPVPPRYSRASTAPSCRALEFFYRWRLYFFFGFCGLYRLLMGPKDPGRMGGGAPGAKKSARPRGRRWATPCGSRFGVW